MVGGKTKPLRVVIRSKRVLGRVCVNRDYALWHKYSVEILLSPAFMLKMRRVETETRSGKTAINKQNTA